MPHPLVLALFADRVTAAAAAHRVRELGVGPGSLSVVARTHAEEGAIAQAIDGTPGVEIEDSRLGWMLGELSGHILAAIAMVLPGIGPIVTAGPLAADLGEMMGHVTGGLEATLRKAGLPGDRAAAWHKRLEGGAVLLGVHTRDEDASRVRQALEQDGTADVAMATWEG
jgi:hypothetical protein